MSTPDPTRFKLVFFVPPQYLPDIKTAIFATGAGSYPNYNEVCFTTPGVSQFRPSDSATPVIGARGQLEEVGEVKCEMVCNGREMAERAVAALKGYSFLNPSSGSILLTSLVQAPPIRSTSIRSLQDRRLLGVKPLSSPDCQLIPFPISITILRPKITKPLRSSSTPGP